MMSIQVSAHAVSANRVCGHNAPPLSFDRQAYLAQGGVVHLGVGAFHRAHQAVYFDELARQGVSGFAVTGVSLRGLEVSEQLNPQDGLYGVMSLSEAAPSVRWIGVMDRVLHAPSDPKAVIAALSAPTTWLVTLTITEKGYCHQPASGELDLNHPDIQHDLAHPDAPRSALGLLLAAIKQRATLGLAPLVILCCDNLPSNGRLLRGLVHRLGAQTEPLLAEHISATAFPCTMVDRIVPASTDGDRQQAENLTGLSDHGLVKAEPFSQWVIEASDARLEQLAQVGALLVPEVKAFELIKLRLLNGSHSFLAYLGYLSGYAFVADAMQDSALRTLVAHLMQLEVRGTLEIPPGFELDDYIKQLLQRFSNPALQHQTWQIAMDGSQKIPQRWLQTLASLRDRHQSHRLLSLALAAWMHYITGRNLQGAEIDVRDPLTTTFSDLAARHHDQPLNYVRSVLKLKAVFPWQLGDDDGLHADIAEHFIALQEHGIQAHLQTVLGKSKYRP